METRDGRERIVRLWFDMWLQKSALRISDVFSDDAVYIESWGPEYRGLPRIRQWFDEWNTRGSVLRWDIRQFFHKGDQTVVEWCFKDAMHDGQIQAFDGMSLIEWTPEDKNPSPERIRLQHKPLRSLPGRSGPAFRGREAPVVLSPASAAGRRRGVSLTHAMQRLAEVLPVE